MINSQLWPILIATICTLQFSFTSAQVPPASYSYYEWFDDQVGIENTGLYHGVYYLEQYRTINEKTKFLASPNFLTGSVIYDGQPYSDLLLKYDVYEDELLLRVKDELGGATIKLFKNKITSFKLGDRQFIHVHNTPAHSGISGFYEISMEGRHFTLLTKHAKKAYARKDRSAVYYEFLDLKKQQLLRYNDQYYPLENKRDLKSIFPEQEEQIDAFYNSAKTLKRNDPDTFLKALLNRIDNLRTTD